MKIAFVSSEVAPFAKTGGLGDIVGALPKAIKRLGGLCLVIAPKYKCVDVAKFDLKLLDYNISVSIAGDNKRAEIYQTKIDDDIPVYFINNDDYFYRDGFYVENGVDYPDNAERFAFFSKAGFQLLKALGVSPDIIHCSDWQTGLIPAYIKNGGKVDDFFKNTSTLFTIHNAAFQGIFDSRYLDLMGLSQDAFVPEYAEFYGKINLLKCGAAFADRITTVSETYAKEIQTEEFGCGLNFFFRDHNLKLGGITNGIDDEEWNPAKDINIARQYSVNDLTGKEACKKELLEIFGLKYSEGTPLIGIISRLDAQKGFDLIEEIMGQLMELDIQMCLVGVGNKEYHSFFNNAASIYKDKFAVKTVFDNTLAHKVEAGADMFLMPSKFEPCGMNQLYSLKYGTIPIVRDTGGLSDTIKAFNNGAENANGFKFAEYSGAACLDAVKTAVNIFCGNKDQWRSLMINAMNEDHSWDVSAAKYLKLYQELKGGAYHE